MDFTQEQREKLGEFTERVDCAQNFSCYDLEPEILFRKRDLGLEEHLECVGCKENPSECQYALLIFGNIYLCTCPVRNYIADNMAS